MNMDYKIISADDHLDLGYLPQDFWTRNMARSYAQRAPHVEARNGTALWVCEDKVWGGLARRDGGRQPTPRPPRGHRP